jgi:hypothetical protein
MAVNNRVNKKKFYLYYISILLNKNKSPYDICKSLGISKQRVYPLIKHLIKEGYIVKKGLGTWERVKDFSVGLTSHPESNLHAFRIDFPIKEGTINDLNNWRINKHFNNWLPSYTTIKSPLNLEVQNNNNKSLTIWAKSRNIDDFNDVDNLGFAIRAFAFDYFKRKYNVVLDIWNAETKNIHIETKAEPLKDLNRKGQQITVDLGKKSEKIFPKDNLDAKAWIDFSMDNKKVPLAIGTNDKEWWRAFLTLPLHIGEYNTNIKLHTEVQLEQLKTQKQMQELLKQLLGRLK